MFRVRLTSRVLIWLMAVLVSLQGMPGDGCTCAAQPGRTVDSRRTSDAPHRCCCNCREENPTPSEPDGYSGRLLWENGLQHGEGLLLLRSGVSVRQARRFTATTQAGSFGEPQSVPRSSGSANRHLLSCLWRFGKDASQMVGRPSPFPARIAASCSADSTSKSLWRER